MKRSRSHFERREPILEKIFQTNRFQKVEPLIGNGAKLLDLGCGFNGELLKRVSLKISEGMGYDLSVTKRKVAGNVKLLAARLDQNLKLQSNHFNVVVSMAVIEHLENPAQMLNQAYKALRRGGCLILTTPSPKSKALLEFLAYRIHVVSEEEIKDHKNYYNKKDLIDLLCGSGFRKEKVKITPFELGFNTLAISKK